MSARFSAPVVKATAFYQASIERWRDARCLHEAERFQGAIYLCGYAVECYLKFCYCVSRKVAGIEVQEAKRLGHELVELLDAAGYSRLLIEERDLHLAFQRISDRWSTSIRYSGGAGTARESEQFLRDSMDLLLWLKKTASKS